MLLRLLRSSSAARTCCCPLLLQDSAEGGTKHEVAALLLQLLLQKAALLNEHFGIGIDAGKWVAGGGWKWVEVEVGGTADCSGQLQRIPSTCGEMSRSRYRPTLWSLASCPAFHLTLPCRPTTLPVQMAA